MQKCIDLPKPFPWYVHILGGWSVGGLVPWFLTIRQFYKRERRKTAFLLSILNLFFFISVCAFGLLSHLPWDTLSLSILGVSLVWSLGAWLTQLAAFGKAPQRLYLKEWRNWFPPVISAVLLGIGISVVLSSLPLIVDRIQMYQSRDLLTKQVILWEFFRYTPFSLLISLPLGLWWAGERERFSTSFILAYIFGLPLFYIIFSAISALFFFILGQGNGYFIGTAWSVMSPDIQGIQRFIVNLVNYDYSPYFVAPLLLGFTPRIRDFLRKSLVIFPLLSISFLCYLGYTYQFWQFYQGHVFYDMSSDKIEQQNRANSKAQLILDRFSEHQGWPEIALKLARHYYFQEDLNTAKNLYKTIYNRTKNSPRWQQEADFSAAVLCTEKFGDQSRFFELQLPSIRYESYMTNNWMVLLRLMRFYEGGDSSESQTLIRLKDISKSEKEIKLSPMPSLAELDDSAMNLRYDVLYLPSELAVIQNLVRKGYPVIQPIKHSFSLLFGLDDGRSAVESICYKDIFYIVKKTKKEDFSAAFHDRPEDRESSDGQSRIDKLARKEISYTFWTSSRQKDMASHIAVVFPKDKRNAIISILDISDEELTRTSDGYLASLIGLNSLTSGDVIQAIKWSYQSYLLENKSFPLHVAHLTKLFWQTRDQRVGHNLKLDKQLPQLTQIDDFLAQADVANFLKKSSTRFYADLNSNNLSWMIRNQYKDFLDRSSQTDRQHLVTIAESNVLFEPESRKQWLFLAEANEWEKDNDQIKKSYDGALKAGQWDDTIALKLAYLHVQADEFPQAKELLGKISFSNVKFNPDYYYCKAVVAQWQHDDSKAIKYFEKAIKMRRFDPNYHTGYADFLNDRKSSPERAEKLRAWSNRLTKASTNKSI